MSDKKKKSRADQRLGLSELLSAVADIPADITNGMTLEMRGRNELLLCGCREIFEYSQGRIRILQGRCPVCVYGRRLAMNSFSEGRIVVCGEIDRIDFCGGGDCEEKNQDF